jgi:hypothetical protein
VGSDLGDWCAASCPESAADGEVRLLVVLVEALASSGPRGFNIFGKVFPAGGLGGLSTFGDSLSGAGFFACEADWISWGTLHGACKLIGK